MCTKEEILDGIVRDWATPVTRGDAHEAMEVYAKEQAALAFDAGYRLAAKHETNHPKDALTKDEYLAKMFPSGEKVGESV